MGYLTSHPGWADISLNLDTGHVFVQEKWHYEWFADPGAEAWSLAEKRAFHALVDQQIWSVWSSGQFHLRVRGKGEFVRKFPTRLPVSEFDIKWVLKGGHWQVRARKTAPGAALTRDDDSEVKFRERKIFLTKKDFGPNRGAQNAAGKTTAHFPTGAHEFGHTVATSKDNLHDEYGAGNANLADTDSIMNIGRKVRARHIEALLEELNKMIPGTQFYL